MCARLDQIAETLTSIARQSQTMKASNVTKMYRVSVPSYTIIFVFICIADQNVSLRTPHASYFVLFSLNMESLSTVSKIRI
jgi:hypothetical protein